MPVINVKTGRATLYTENKMQSETADVAPGTAIWRNRRNVRILFDSGPFAPLCETLRYPQNRMYITYCIAVRVHEHSQPTGAKIRLNLDVWLLK